MMHEPTVLLPEDFNLEEAWASCNGDDPGVTSCPKCDKYYWRWGVVIQCQCGYKFPTNWFDSLRDGINDRRMVDLPNGQRSAGMERRYALDTYYAVGYDHPTMDVDKPQDWQQLLGEDYDPVSKPPMSGRDRLLYCDRCGKLKPENERSRYGICMSCEAETTCEHRTGFVEKQCRAGVVFAELRATLPPDAIPAWPCFWYEGCKPNMQCGKFEPVGLKVLQDKEVAIQATIARIKLSMPFIASIKQEFKGQNFVGTRQCPVCSKTLSIRHAAYNGHVAVRCETEDCLNFME